MNITESDWILKEDPKEILRAEIRRGLVDLERDACRDYEVDDLPELGERIKAACRKAFEAG